MTVSATRAERQAARLLRGIGLDPRGPVTWGDAIPLGEPGVYVVEVPDPAAAAPIDEAAVAAWIDRVPSLRLDGARPTAVELSARLASFWVAGEQVVYIGLAGTSVAKRVRQFCRTPLGDRRPHAGGHWVRTLECRDELLVSWAAAANPAVAEAALLARFADLHDGALPFANRVSARGRKAHGITGSVLADAMAPRTTSSHSPRPATRRSASADVAAINAALQALAARLPEREIDAVTGGEELGRLRLLRDSATRPGKPLRDLLRAGLIEGAYQGPNGRWRIPARR